MNEYLNGRIFCYFSGDHTFDQQLTIIKEPDHTIKVVAVHMDDVVNGTSYKPVENNDDRTIDESENMQIDNYIEQDDDGVCSAKTKCNDQNILNTHQSAAPDSRDDEPHTNAKGDILVGKETKNLTKVDANVSIERNENNLVEHNRYKTINDLKSPDVECNIPVTRVDIEEKLDDNSRYIDSAVIDCMDEYEKTSDDKLVVENGIECLAGTRNIAFGLITESDKNNTNLIDINSIQNEDIGSKAKKSTHDSDDTNSMPKDNSSDKGGSESYIAHHTSESTKSKLEQKSPNNDNIDLFNLLRGDDTSNHSFDTNYEYAESSNDGESTKMAEIDDVIENAIEGLGIPATSSCETDVANGQEAEENNLLEAMTAPVRSISRSCEGSLSSFRDEYDAMVNEFDGVDYDGNADISNDFNCIISGKLDESNGRSYHESEGVQSSIRLKELEDMHNKKEAMNERYEDDIEMDKDQIINRSPESETSQIDEPETIAVSNDITSMDSYILNTQCEKSDSIQTDAYEPLVKRIRLDIIGTDEAASELKQKPDDSLSDNINVAAPEVDEDADGEFEVIVNANANKRRADSIEQVVDDIELRKKPKVLNDESLDIGPSTQLLKLSTELPDESQLDNKQDGEAINKEPTIFVTGSVDLTPKPERVEKRSIPLDFLKKFRSGFSEMTRTDLEELVLSKIVEAILHKSEYSDLKHQVESQEQVIVSFRSKIQDLMKQYRDLEMVYTRLKKDLENKNASAVTPIKITRAVGLQVHLQKTNGKEANAVPAATMQSKSIEKPLITNTAQILGRKIPNQRTPAMQKQQQTQPLHHQQQQQTQHQPPQQKQQHQLKQVQQLKQQQQQQQQLLQKSVQSQSVRPQLVATKAVPVNFGTRVIATGNSSLVVSN